MVLPVFLLANFTYTYPLLVAARCLALPNPSAKTVALKPVGKVSVTSPGGTAFLLKTLVESPAQAYTEIMHKARAKIANR